MRLPPKGSSFLIYVRYGRYVSRRLRRAGRTDLADGVRSTVDEVRTTGRLWEDADEALQDALADRDGADDDLDEAARHCRANLAGRSASAEREEPYTLIFPKGVGYYTAAPLPQEEARYNELKLRLEEHLPASDAVRKSTVAAISKGLKDFREATAEHTEATAREALAGTRARQAIANFERQIEKTYGALLVEVGRAAAEGFFPKAASSRSGEGDDGTKGHGDPPPTP